MIVVLQDSLESYHDTDFWYVDRGIAVAEIDSRGVRHSMQRQEEKWWLPTPKVPPNGLSENSKKHLHNQRDATSQILKAAMAINAQTLFEMEVPSMYFDSLPKVLLIWNFWLIHSDISNINIVAGNDASEKQFLFLSPGGLDIHNLYHLHIQLDRKKLILDLLLFL